MSRILLVNPPIYDFSAFDFWLKPYGLLRIAGYLRGQAEIELFDFLDRKHPEAQTDPKTRSDEWGRGRFPAREVGKPSAFGKIPRKFRRYGLREETFEDFLSKEGPFDFALIQTGMTYWYLGLKEVLATLKKISPATRTVFGGPYATICPTHARTLAPDLVIEGLNLDPLWQQIGLSPDSSQTALWESYRNLEVGVLKLSDGCPFRCTYCSVPQVYPRFRSRPLETAIAATRQLTAQGVENIVFYDDALLFKTDEILSPFLEQVESLGVNVNFHTPNALNARFVTGELAQRMVSSGFKNFYLGFESGATEWQRKTGGKVYSNELERAVGHLSEAGCSMERITCYMIVGHPNTDSQELEASIRFASGLGLRVMLSEFSPIPGTPDGEICRQWINLDEPLLHNKTAYTHLRLGNRLQELKAMVNELNANKA